MPLNYMGYVTELRNIADPLPHNLSAKDYAGIVVAPGGNLLGRQMELTNWYKDLLKKNTCSNFKQLRFSSKRSKCKNVWFICNGNLQSYAG